MSVPKKSLIGSRPTEEKKAKTKPTTKTAIGESKGLTAKALNRQALKIDAMKRRGGDF